MIYRIPKRSEGICPLCGHHLHTPTQSKIEGLSFTYPSDRNPLNMKEGIPSVLEVEGFWKKHYWLRLQCDNHKCKHFWQPLLFEITEVETKEMIDERNADQREKRYPLIND